MARSQKQITLGGILFALQPIPARKCGELERELLKVLSPMLPTLRPLLDAMVGGAVGSKSSDAEKGEALLKALGGVNIDLDAISQQFTNALKALAPYEFDNLLCSMLAYVMAQGPQGMASLNSGERIDAIMPDTMTMYRLMFEVARFNKFIPFGVLDGGEQIQTTGTSPTLAQGASAT